MSRNELKPLPRTFSEMGEYRYDDYTNLTWLGRANEIIDAIEALGYNPHDASNSDTEDYMLVSQIARIWHELVLPEYSI